MIAESRGPFDFEIITKSYLKKADFYSHENLVSCFHDDTLTRWPLTMFITRRAILNDDLGASWIEDQAVNLLFFFIADASHVFCRGSPGSPSTK